MNWLFPAFLFGAAAVALPILLHLLRRRPTRTVVFPSLRFLSATHQKNDRHQRLRRWIVLALRCAALGLLAAAFARPFFGARGAQGGRAVVVVVDNSFSLQTKGRWETLHSWAQDQVGRLSEADKLGILLMAPRPAWLTPLRGDPGVAAKTLAGLQPGWEASRVEPALRLAADTLAATAVDRREIIFLSDHQRVSWAGCDFGKPLPAGVAVAFPAVPAAVSRQAAVLPPVMTRREGGVHAAVTVRNYTGPQKRMLSVFRDGAQVPAHVEPVDLADRATVTLQIDLEADAQKAVYFRFVLDADDLPADDTAYAIWQGTEEHPVLLDPVPAGGGGDYLAAALASTADLKPALRMLPATRAAWPVGTVAILRNDTSFAGEAGNRLGAFFNGGGSALVFASGPAEQAWLAAHGIPTEVKNAESGPWQAQGWDMDHPLVSGLAEHRVNALLGWDFTKVLELPARAIEPLALWPDNTVAIGEAKIGAGRLLVCGFGADRRESEWPVQPVFVPFVHRAIAYLMGAQEAGATKPVQVGDTVGLPAESGNWHALDGPAATKAPLAVSSTVVPEMPGVYEFTYGPERKLFAVNLAQEESDPALWTDGKPWTALVSPQPSPDVRQDGVPLASIDAEQRAPLWWWCIAALALLLLFELGLSNRTTR